jgi:membrane-bound serine protease (ClpP class)
MNRRAIVSGLLIALGVARLAAGSLGERIAHIATNPELSGLLLGVGFAGLLVEMQTLRLVAGVAGAAALAFFFASHLAVAPDALVVGLAALGLLGILLELHVLPGHGVAGVLGIAALLGAVGLTFGPAPFVAVVQALSIAVVVCVALYLVAVRIYPRNAFAQRLVFGHVQGADYVAAPDYRALIGHEGFASSFLRPAGVAAIDGQRIDVLTEGEFVAAGTPVVVTRVEGARIFVRPEKENR